MTDIPRLTVHVDLELTVNLEDETSFREFALAQAREDYSGENYGAGDPTEELEELIAKIESDVFETFMSILDPMNLVRHVPGLEFNGSRHTATPIETPPEYFVV